MKLLATMLVVTFFVPSTITYTAPQRDEADIFLEELSMCESSNRWDIKVLDVNNKYSYGGLQFQKATFKHFGKRYGFFGDITDNEAEKLLFDKKLQLGIAKKMYLDGLADDHWVNCWANIRG